MGYSSDYKNSSSAADPKADGKARRLKNLRPPWKKGEVGNPTGRNGWDKHTDLLAEIARMVFEKNTDALYKVLTREALKGNAHIINLLADRAFGKVRDRIELTGDASAPVQTQMTVHVVERKTDAELGLAPLPVDLQSRIDSGQLTKLEAFSILRDRPEGKKEYIEPNRHDSRVPAEISNSDVPSESAHPIAVHPQIPAHNGRLVLHRCACGQPTTGPGLRCPQCAAG